MVAGDEFGLSLERSATRAPRFPSHAPRATLSRVVRVLFVTGPPGVGKSAVLREADVLLVAAGSRHASIDLDEIVRSWPPGGDIRDRNQLERLNLAALWRNFAARGVDRLMLAGLVKDRADVERLANVVAGAVTTVVRLHAPLETLQHRIHRRDARPEGELAAARWWTDFFARHAIEDQLVDAGDDRPVREVATAVLLAAGWLP